MSLHPGLRSAFELRCQHEPHKSGNRSSQEPPIIVEAPYPLSIPTQVPQRSAVGHGGTLERKPSTIQPQAQLQPTRKARISSSRTPKGRPRNLTAGNTPMPPS